MTLKCETNGNINIDEWMHNIINIKS